MKTRIKIIERNDGSKCYEAQYKKSFMTFDEMYILLLFIPIIGWWTFVYFVFFKYVSLGQFSTIDNAKHRIDNILKEKERLDMATKSQQIKKTTYLKYP